MNDESTYYPDLITRYFAGEATAEEADALAAWLGEKEDHQILFDDYRRSWLAVEQLNIEENIDFDSEFEILKSKISGETETPEYRLAEPFAPRSRSLLYRIGRIAAVLILVAISSATLYFIFNSQKEVKLTAELENKIAALPDGSKITLTPGTTLVYPETFEKKIRKVKLQGEAYFEVTHYPDRPFVIMTEGNINIEVLGTSFYVNSNDENNKVEVILTSGKVAVYYSNKPDERTILNPGDKVEMSKKQEQVQKSVNNEPNYMAWKTGKLVFSDTKLDKVVSLLNKVYHTDVRLADKKLGNCTITATFDKQSIESVLNVIKETLSLNISKKGNIVEISGNSCK